MLKGSMRWVTPSQTLRGRRAVSVVTWLGTWEVPEVVFSKDSSCHQLDLNSMGAWSWHWLSPWQWDVPTDEGMRSLSWAARISVCPWGGMQLLA